jgi:nucleotide-binding universal stress UspA family protein
MKNYRPIRSVLVCLEEGTATDRAVSQAGILLKGLKIPIDLGLFEEAGKEDAAQTLLGEARKMIASAGLEAETRVLQGSPIEGFIEIAPSYDLLVLGMPRGRKLGPLIKGLLKAMPSPLMLCP